MKINLLTKYINFVLAVVILLVYPCREVVGQDSSIVFNENFESKSKPNNWSYNFEKGTIEWQYQEGGYTTNDSISGSGHPPYAFQGNYNAMFHYASYQGEKTKLITPPINLKYSIKPELIFWHAQDERKTF